MVLRPGEALSLFFEVKDGALVNRKIRERNRSNDEGCLILYLTRYVEGNPGGRQTAKALVNTRDELSVRNLTGRSVTITGTARHPGWAQPSAFSLECKIDRAPLQLGEHAKKRFGRDVTDIRITSFAITPRK